MGNSFTEMTFDMQDLINAIKEQQAQWQMPDPQEEQNFLNSVLAQWDKQTPQQQQQEPPTGTQYANTAVFEGLNATKNPPPVQQPQMPAQTQQAANVQVPVQPAQQSQPQAPQQMLVPQQLDIMNQIAAYKNAYENAETIVRQLNPKEKDEAKIAEKVQAFQDTAHKNADRLRQIAKGAGLDLSGVEDVGFDDAQRNLMTRQTKEVADILSGQGKYGRSSDQYFDDEYMALIGEGKSANDAKRIAGQKAQRYQAERVTYLRNAFNMYGRNGNYVNEDGVPIIQEIAAEMPQVAQIYSDAYKLPTHLQDRAEKLEDYAIEHQNRIEEYGAQGAVNLNLQRDANSFTEKRDATQHRYNIETIRESAAAQFDTWSKQKDIETRIESGKLRREAADLYQTAFAVATLAGADEKTAAKYASDRALAFVNGKTATKGKGGTADTDNPRIGDLQKYLDSTNKRIDELNEQYLKTGDQQVKAEIAELVAKRKEIEGQMNAALGVGKQDYHFTGNMDENKATLEALYLKSGRDYPSFRDAVEQLMDLEMLKDDERANIRKLVAQYRPKHN